MVEGTITTLGDQPLFPSKSIAYPMLDTSITDESFNFSPCGNSTDDSLGSPTSFPLTPQSLDWDQKDFSSVVMKSSMDSADLGLSNELMSAVPLYYDTAEIGLGVENAFKTNELENQKADPFSSLGDIEVPNTNEVLGMISSPFQETVDLNLGVGPSVLTRDFDPKEDSLGIMTDDSDPVLNFPPFDPLEYFSGAVNLEDTDADAFMAEIPMLSIDESMNIAEFTPSVTETNDMYNPENSYSNSGKKKKTEEAVSLSLKCKECPSIFKSKRNLNTHTRKNHPRSKKFGCTHCGTFFSANCNLNKHIKAVHYKIREHVCTVPNCEKRFTEANKLDKHIKNVHEQQREFTCDRPGCTSEKNQFSQQSDLKRHIDLVHLKLFRYICVTCKVDGKKSNFGRRSSLFQHLKRIHKLDAKRASYLLNAGKKLVDGKEWTKVAPAKHSVSIL